MSARGRKKSKSVRMSVDFTAAADEADCHAHIDPAPVPTFVVSNGDPPKAVGVSNGGLVNGGGGGGGKFSLGETDPLLIMAASYFVQELLYKAQIEAHRRLAMGVEVKTMAVIFLIFECQNYFKVDMRDLFLIIHQLVH